MDQRLSIITLGVRDLTTARAFYEEALGWQRNNTEDAIAFYDVGGIVLALFQDGALADDIGVGRSDPSATPYRGFTLALNLGSREAVDTLFDELRHRGVTIVKEPHAAFWGGYSGYFADADGHHWEVAHNPYWPLDASGVPRPS